MKKITNHTDSVSKIILASALLLVIAACSKDTARQNQLPLVKETSENSCSDFENKSVVSQIVDGISEIISTRPQNSDRFMAVIKLKNPALLSTSKLVNGVRTIDQEELKKINLEQDAAIAEMKKMSANVCTMYRYKIDLLHITLGFHNYKFRKLS